MKNLDGIKQTKIPKKILAPRLSIKHILPVDGISASKVKTNFVEREVFLTNFSVPPQAIIPAPISFWQKLTGSFNNWAKNLNKNTLESLWANSHELAQGEWRRFVEVYNRQRVPVLAAVFGVMLAFGGGAWAALTTTKTAAEDIMPPPAASVTIPSTGNLGPINNVPNEVLYNMTIGQLENYLNNVAEEGRQAKAAERMATRKEKLRAYLQGKKTPFASVADTIAEQPHWKLILAISFAESTFGKNCVDNNCSNIGVKPGHDYWRKYKTLNDWVIDFNRLLERRYKNWSLEQMNGVYVQPKNPNWLAATRQILEELQEQGIE